MGASCPIGSFRDLTIRQRRLPWIRRWKIDFSSFHFFSRLFQGAQLLKRREFSLELKRRDRAWVLTEMLEFIVLPFLFPSKLKIWSFHFVTSCAGTAKKCTKKCDSRAELLFGSLNVLLIWRSSCRRLRKVPFSNDDADGNENVKTAIPVRFTKQNNKFARASRFLAHFFVVTARLWRKMPNFKFYGGSKQATTKFSFSFSF